MSVLTAVHVNVPGQSAPTPCFSDGVRTEIEDVDIGKARMTVTPAKDDHLVADQIGRMVPLALGDVALRRPFLPCEAGRVGDVQCPDIVQRRLAVAPAENDEEVPIEYGRVCSARWRE